MAFFATPGESRPHDDWHGGVWLRNSNKDQSYAISNIWGENVGKKLLT
jgi:hypothetical protein